MASSLAKWLFPFGKPRVPAIRVASVSFCLLTAGWFVFDYVRKGPGSVPLLLPAPMVSVALGGGEVLEVLYAGDGHVQAGDMVPKAGRNKPKSLQGMVSAQVANATIATTTLNDELIGMRFETSPGHLVLVTRLLDESGSPVDTGAVHWRGTVRSGRQVEDFAGWEEMMDSSHGNEALPGILVQLADGAGGWIDGGGPWIAEDDPECRGMLVFSAWPRSTDELEFRVLRPGMPPAAWEMKNPLRPEKPSLWTTEPLPQIQAGSDFELELLGVEQEEGLRVIRPRYQFWTGITTADGSQGLHPECVELLGAWGSRTPGFTQQIPGRGEVAGFPFPPDEEILRFRFMIRPTANHPYPRGRSLMIASAKIAEDGRSIAGRTNLLGGHGVLSVDFHEIRTGMEGGFRYTIRGFWGNQAEREAGKSAIGHNEKITVCFLNADTHSSGTANSNGHSVSSSNESTHFEYRGIWSGALEAGDEIFLGRTTRLPDREVFFTFEL